MRPHPDTPPSVSLPVGHRYRPLMACRSHPPTLRVTFAWPITSICWRESFMRRESRAKGRPFPHAVSVYGWEVSWPFNEDQKPSPYPFPPIPYDPLALPIPTISLPLRISMRTRPVMDPIRLYIRLFSRVLGRYVPRYMGAEGYGASYPSLRPTSAPGGGVSLSTSLYNHRHESRLTRFAWRALPLLVTPFSLGACYA